MSSISSLIQPATEFSPQDICCVCLETLEEGSITSGVPTIHASQNGAKHPMHRNCFFQSVNATGACPLCRTRISPYAFHEEKKKEYSLEMCKNVLLVANACSLYFSMNDESNRLIFSITAAIVINTGMDIIKIRHLHSINALDSDLRTALTSLLTRKAMAVFVPISCIFIAQKIQGILFGQN